MCVELYHWSIELEGIFVLPLAPRWVRHYYLSKKATNYPLYLWVIKTFFWRCCRGAITWGEYSCVCLFALSLSSFLFSVLTSSLSLVMDMEHETPKKLVVLATHGDGNLLKPSMLIIWILCTTLIILRKPHSIM